MSNLSTFVSIGFLRVCFCFFSVFSVDWFFFLFQVLFATAHVACFLYPSNEPPNLLFWMERKSPASQSRHAQMLNVKFHKSLMQHIKLLMHPSSKTEARYPEKSLKHFRFKLFSTIYIFFPCLIYTFSCFSITKFVNVSLSLDFWRYAIPFLILKINLSCVINLQRYTYSH